MEPGDQKKEPELTLATLKLCERVLDMQTLEVRAGDFEEVALDVIKAKREIKDAINARTQETAEAEAGK